jgi:hypothetical protein
LGTFRLRILLLRGVMAETAVPNGSLPDDR